MSKIFILQLVASLIALAGLGRASSDAVGITGLVLGKEVAASPTLPCSPDKPTVLSGDSIQVRVWVDPSQPGLRYDWTATGGNIKGQNDKAVWDFKAVTPGIYESTVTATTKTNGSVMCTIQVIVREHIMGGEHAVPRRSFLLKGQSEPPGYGLYSYILFGSPPDDSSRDRFLVAIDAYLREISEIERLEELPSVDRTQLNVTFLPIDMPPPREVSAEWSLAHYDYARASVMLAKLPRTYITGPYIVSLLKPLGATNRVSGPYLFQNLSIVPAVPKDLLSWWLREFQRQAAQERFWEESTGQQLTLKLRTIVAILAIGFPEVRKGLDTAIAWVH
jgi:hypothetical protein